MKQQTVKPHTPVIGVLMSSVSVRLHHQYLHCHPPHQRQHQYAATVVPPAQQPVSRADRGKAQPDSAMLY